MRLSSLSIESFRGLRNQPVGSGAVVSEPVAMLVGHNGGGMSNVLSALSMLRSLVDMSRGDRPDAWRADAMWADEFDVRAPKYLLAQAKYRQRLTENALYAEVRRRSAVSAARQRSGFELPRLESNEGTRWALRASRDYAARFTTVLASVSEPLASSEASKADLLRLLLAQLHQTTARVRTAASESLYRWFVPLPSPPVPAPVPGYRPRSWTCACDTDRLAGPVVPRGPGAPSRSVIPWGHGAGLGRRVLVLAA